MIRFVLALFWWLAAFFRSHHDPGLELVPLRQQVGALKRKNPRPRLGLFQPGYPPLSFWRRRAASSSVSLALQKVNRTCWLPEEGSL